MTSHTQQMKNSQMKFYCVRGPRFWGDYGRVLANGFTRKGVSDGDPVLLLRTGPFIPPISFPSAHIVITDAFRNQLENAELSKYQFRDVVKFHIAKLHWERWDRNDEGPPIIPRSGEPEDYVLERWHSPIAAGGMGAIWELILPKGAVTAGIRTEGRNRRKPGQRIWDVMVDPETWSGDYFFRSTNRRHTIATRIGADWLIENCGDWIVLDECVPWDPGRIDA